VQIVRRVFKQVEVVRAFDSECEFLRGFGHPGDLVKVKVRERAEEDLVLPVVALGEV
jgi:hypothetical protein